MVTAGRSGSRCARPAEWPGLGEPDSESDSTEVVSDSESSEPTLAQWPALPGRRGRRSLHWQLEALRSVGASDRQVMEQAAGGAA
jgi:hypothetical protein